MKRLMVLLLLVLLAVPFAGAQHGDAGDTGDTGYDAALQALLESATATDEPGVVLYVRLGDASWAGARGMADLEAGAPLQTDDSFRIGSITKTFVAALTLQLVEEGVLALDAGIDVYLPEDVYRRIPHHDTITLRHLLNMTAGVYDYTESELFDERVEREPAHPWTPAEILAFIDEEEAPFAPGEDWAYSNSNYIVLQLVIEYATGERLADLLEAYIFAPLGMDDSFLEMPDHFAEAMVRGYIDWGGGDFEDITAINDGVGLADGGIVTTAADLAGFPGALLAGALFDAALLDQMLDYVPADGGLYGLGISDIGPELGVDAAVIGHDGATSGFLAEMWYVPDEDLTVVVLTNNFDSAVTYELVQDVITLVLED